MIFSVFLCQENYPTSMLFWHEHEEYPAIYCFDIQEWYGTQFYIWTVQKRRGGDIKLSLGEYSGDTPCPSCGLYCAVIQKTTIKKATDVFMFEYEYMKKDRVDAEKCFAPASAGLIELEYQSHTYRCLNCNTLFHKKNNFILSEKSHYTKRYVSFLKHYDHYWSTINSYGNRINVLTERWNNFRWNGQDEPECPSERRPRFDIKKSTYYYLTAKTQDIEVRRFSRSMNSQKDWATLLELPYVLKKTARI